MNELGSALSLEECFWGHDHGTSTDLVDFTFAPETDLTLAAKLLGRFKHMRPNARGELPRNPVWYRESEIGPALSSQFPVFKRHFVGFAIPELRKAVDDDGLRFRSLLSTIATA